MSKAFWNYAAAAVSAYFGQWQLAASFLASGVGAERQRRARNQARDAYNASLQDRMVMLDLQPDAPRTLVLGRVRAVEGVRRRWTSGTNSEKLTLIVSFAGHEIDAFEQIWFNDIPVTLDGNGWVQTAPYLKTSPRSDYLETTLDGSGNASVTLTSAPISGTVAAVATVGIGANAAEHAVTLSGTGTSYTLTGGPASAPCVVTWQTSVGTSLARVRTYRGTAAQNVGADLAAEYPGQLTSADKFAGIALAVVDLLYDSDAYPQGIPNITATLRGARCLDPRTGTTAWTQNPALHFYHYARHANGWAVPVGDISAADVIAAADFCDTSTTFALGVDAVTLPRYRCGVVIATDADPREAMADIMETMAGRWGWAGGTLRMRCGRMAGSVFALDESWVAQRIGDGGMPEPGSVVRISNGVPRDLRVNRVSGKCIDPDQRYQLLPYPAVQDAVLIAADGSEYPTTVDLAGVDHIAHAQHLASITIRQAQAALRMELQANLSAYRCELFDVGTVTIGRYGMAAKTFEVVGWKWRPADGITLKLAEITADIFSVVSTLEGRDPAPNTNLPPPWSVPTITGVAVSSGTTALTDGSVLTRTRITWTQPASQAVLASGHIEVQYTEAGDVLPAGDWQSWVEQGSATQAVIPGLLTERFYVFRVRAINSVGVRGPWSLQVLHQVAAPPPTAGQYTDFIFQRAATIPATPTGTTPAGWFDAPPAADGNPLWVSTATRQPDGSLIGVWSTPVQIDGASLQVEYSVDGATGWHATFTPGDKYARYRIGGSGAWSAAVKIVGEDGNFTDYVFRRAATVPATPTGVGTPAGWFDEPPASDGNPLWVSIATKRPDGSLVGAWSDPVQIDGASVQVEYSVDGVTGWHLTFTTGDIWARYRIGATGSWSASVRIVGEAGANGVRTAVLRMYRWAPGAPLTYPSGTSTYTWASATFTAPATPNGWTITPGAAVSGQTLWAIEQRYADNGTSATSAVTWASASPFPVGAAGQGTQGQSAARAYALYTGNPVVTGGVVVTSGAALPGAAAWSPTAASAWSANTQTPGVGQAMFQSDGLYDPGSNTTTWQVPYLSNLKVGNLAALSAVVDGLQSTTVTQAGSWTSGAVQVALAANTSNGAVIGVFGQSSAAFGAGLQGQSTSATGRGVLGVGAIGVEGRGNTGGVGVSGTAAGSGSIGIQGRSDGNASYGGYFSTGGTGAAASNTALYATATGNQTALRVAGRAQFDDRVTFTTAGVPLVLPVVSAKPAAVFGGVALHSSYGLIVSDGTNWYAASALIPVP